MSLPTVDDVPEYAMLWLPPFPKFAKPIALYHNWQSAGVHIPASGSNSKMTRAPHDGGGRCLVDIAQDHTPESRAARNVDRQHKRLAEGGSLVRLPLDDCFKIGDDTVVWNEPYGTANEGQFDVGTAPFDRLMTATRDFLYTRGEAFRFQRNHRLFNLVRESFGLRGGGSKPHWTTAPDVCGQPTDRDGQESQAYTLQSATAEEGCVLLRDTENAVRGFLALLRREAEAGWEIDPPLQLARISASFFTYIEHHRVFPDEPLKSRFEEAAALARSSPRLLMDAHRLESALADGEGWNRAVWTVWGGQYGGAERGGLEKEMPEWPVAEVSDGELGEDWKVNTVNDTRPMPPTEVDAIALTRARLGSAEGIRMLGHIPYARRRISSVTAPAEMSLGDKSDFRASMYKVVTVPAPWIASEGWRRNPSAGDPGDHNGLEQIEPLGPVGPLEREEATIADPEELILWVEKAAVGGDESGQSLVGMGLRGRWGLFGPSLEDKPGQWWAFKSKDYVLPALWRA